MRESRFFIDQPIHSGSEITLEDVGAHHALHVLRLNPGDQIHLFNGKGGEFSAEVTKTSKTRMSVAVGNHSPTERESLLDLHLAQSVSRGERMDYTIQKAVELGVRSIVPLTTKRTTVKLDDKRKAKRLLHWRNIIVSACEQCGRNTLPDLGPVQSLPAWLASCRPTATDNYVVLRGNADTSLANIPIDGAVTLLVGPEGGLATEELEACGAAGFQAVRLGQRTLRTETAALAAISALQTLHGDFR